MDLLNLKVIGNVRDWLACGDYVYLVTVVNTWGASPRPEGSLFAYNVTSRRSSGSLSGGCIEEDLIEQLAHQAVPSTPIFKRYGDNDNDQVMFELPCGGSVNLLIEYFDSMLSGPHFDEIEKSLMARESISRKVDASTGVVSISYGDSFSGKRIEVDGQVVHHALSPEYKLLIIGMNDISQYLASLAMTVDFSVSICDPRERYHAQQVNFTEGRVDFFKRLPDDLIREKFNDSRCAIVALSHDPRVDDLAMIEALESDAFYVGAMGSINTTKKRFSRLKTLGLTDHDISRLHAPVGVDIHSKTPSEIAIAVIAELVKCRYSHATKNDTKAEC